MTENINFISLKETISRVTRHPMLQDLTLEAGIQYALDFISEIGLPMPFEEKQALVDIKDFRGILPCDLVEVIQVKDEKTGVMLRSMTDSFNGNSFNVAGGGMTFKTSNRVITTSFENGQVRIAYYAIPVDEDELPMLPDNETFQKALELYIKKEIFTIKFDQGQIHEKIMDKAERDYYWMKGRCRSLYKMPSISQMETITGMMHRMIPSKREFQAGFKGMGDREYYKRH